jgi:hypothetical protein
MSEKPTLRELVDHLEHVGVTEYYRLKILRAAEIEKLSAIQGALEEVRANLKNLAENK